MTDILSHISRLINGVFESGPSLNGCLIGMLNLLFNQGKEFIAVGEPVPVAARNV